MKYRKIKEADDQKIAEIIRENLQRLHLDIPGTAYFDPELDHLSAYYNNDSAKRVYFVALDEDGQVSGGVGIAEFDGLEDCAELQKLYLSDFSLEPTRSFWMTLRSSICRSWSSMNSTGLASANATPCARRAPVPICSL